MVSKWGKTLPAHLQLISAQLSCFGARIEISYSILVVIYQNWPFSWSINKMGSEGEKSYELTFGSGERFWGLISNFHIKYWLWYIKIDRFHGQSIKWGQKWKKLYELTFSSGEPFWELIFKFHIKYWLWRIKIDRFHGRSIKWGQKWKKLYELTFGLCKPF